MKKLLVLCLLVVGCADVHGREDMLVGDEPEPEADAAAVAVEQDAGQAPLADAAASPEQFDGASALAAGSDAGQPQADAGERAADASTHDAAQPAPHKVTTDALDLALKSTCDSCHTQRNDIGKPSVMPWLDPTFDRVHVYQPGEALVSDISVSSCNGLPYVTAGSLEQSYLYLHLTAQSPCGQHATVEDLTADKLQALADWIVSEAGGQ